MDIFTFVLGLPVAPVRGLLAVARVVQEEAEREMYDPYRARRKVEDIESAQARDEIDPESAAQEKQEVLDRLIRH